MIFHNVLQHKNFGLVQQGILAWHRLARLVLSGKLKIGELSGNDYRHGCNGTA